MPRLRVSVRWLIGAVLVVGLNCGMLRLLLLSRSDHMFTYALLGCLAIVNLLVIQLGRVLLIREARSPDRVGFVIAGVAVLALVLPLGELWTGPIEGYVSWTGRVVGPALVWLRQNTKGTPNLLARIALVVGFILALNVILTVPWLIVARAGGRLARMVHRRFGWSGVPETSDSAGVAESRSLP